MNATQNNNQVSHPMTSNSVYNRNLTDMSLTELQEIAMRQQQQIEINQQLLQAKEKRLKNLKQEEVKHTQQFNMFAHQQQQNSITHQNNSGDKFDVLKQSVLSQELKIFKLKQLRNQILEYKLSNSNMYSELDLIKNLFEQKERELFCAISKVSELSKQIEQLRKLKQKNHQNNFVNTPNSNIQDQQQSIAAVASHITELERLKQELQIRNKLNEQQAKKIVAQQELFNKKQMEVLTLDKRIEELKERIASKRSYLITNQFNSGNGLANNVATGPNQANHHYQQPNNLGSLRINQRHGLNSPVNELAQSQLSQQNQSPSKLVAKFATKQEIANTYMNKYNSDTYQKFQARMFQQQPQQPAISQNQLILSHSPNGSAGSGSHQQPQNLNFQNEVKVIEEAVGENQSSAFSGTSPSVVNTASIPSPKLTSQAPTSAITNANAATGPTQSQPPSSSSSSLVSLSPISNTSMSVNQTNAKGCRKASYDVGSDQLTTMMINNLKLEDSSALPSHLKLEFDKIKYLPDVVKTIKKRHSISEIESSNTLPPQIFQKILEKHHKNFLEQQGNSASSLPSTNLCSNKLNKISEVAENMPCISPQSVSNEKPTQIQISQKSSNVNNLTTFMPKNDKSQDQIEQVEIVETQIATKSTKSIIKQTQSSTQISGDIGDGNILSRRVNFDPHALLLDAAVEGELDLVMKCAKQVRDISQPNDEGITALHNSVCAGHFAIVKFLVEYGCDINYADNDGWTPLHCAASCNNLQMIRFLIENGASLFATTLSDNETAIRKCEEDEDGFQACFEYLVQAQEQLGSDGVQCYALYDYEAQNDDELSFDCNQRLFVIDKCEGEGDANDGWWLCRLENGQKGLVPKNYLGLHPRIRPRPDALSKNQEESTIC